MSAAKHTPGRQCGFCKTAAPMTSDSINERRYTCPACGAVERIGKGSSSWWYFGWERADGASLRAPTVQEMAAGKYGWQPERAAIAKATQGEQG